MAVKTADGYQRQRSAVRHGEGEPGRERSGGRRFGREPLLPSSFTFPKEHGTMQTVLALRGNARTFLTHFVGDGLDDDRYVVEKYRSLANGNRRRW